MTLRHRLLLVYGIVILLSLGTVGMALFELYRSRQVFGALQYWNEIVLSAQKLRNAFPDQAQSDPLDYASRLAGPYPNLARASDYANVDRAREALNRLSRRYAEWTRAAAADRPERARRSGTHSMTTPASSKPSWGISPAPSLSRTCGSRCCPRW